MALVSRVKVIMETWLQMVLANTEAASRWFSTELVFWKIL